MDKERKEEATDSNDHWDDRQTAEWPTRLQKWAKYFSSNNMIMRLQRRHFCVLQVGQWTKIKVADLLVRDYVISKCVIMHLTKNH